MRKTNFKSVNSLYFGIRTQLEVAVACRTGHVLTSGRGERRH